MQFHRQPPNLLKFSEDGKFLGVFDRRRHMAFEVGCPSCEAKAGYPCKQNGRDINLLAVHLGRLTRFL